MKETEAVVESEPLLLPSFKEVKEEVVAKGERDNHSSEEEDLTIIGKVVSVFCRLVELLVWFGCFFGSVASLFGFLFRSDFIIW